MATTLKLFERTTTTLTLDFTYSGLDCTQVRVQYYPIDNSDDSNNFYIDVEIEIEYTARFELQHLKSDTTYEVVIYRPDAYGEYSDIIIDDEFTTLSNISEDEINGFTIIKEVTSHSAYITVNSSNGDGNEYYYDLYLVNSEIDEEHIHIDGGSKIWEPGENMPIIYQFDNLISDTTYWLETGIPDLGRIEFTTIPISMSISVQEVTSSSIRVRASESPSDNYDYWTWCIRKVGEDTIIEQDGNSSGARTKTFSNLENNTDYYIWLELESFSPEKFDVIGIYVTTLPIEGIFSWTYAGKRKNDNGTYELVLGDTKGADGAEYFYLAADEWNELTSSINTARDKKGDLPVDFIIAVPNADFTWTMYNEVLKNIYDLTNETAPSDKHAVKGGSVTAEKLNHLKDKLNEYLES